MNGKNISESVRQRLLNRAKQENRSFNELLQYYAMERFLYRFSVSEYVDNFILKGALMLRVWNSPEIRPTMDIDMLGRIDNEVSNIERIIREIIDVEVDDDGLIFDAGSIKTEQITEDAQYKGLRVNFNGLLGNAKVYIQIDIGFGDIVYPHPETGFLPTVLDNPSPELMCYSRESAIAEKFHAMVKIGMLNSRMKDFYDIWLLSRHYKFETEELAKAIAATFLNKETAIDDNITAFGKDFTDLKQTMWQAFRKRLKLKNVPENFTEIVSEIEKFLMPAIKIAREMISKMP
ncbi:MAG TPA: nucleotidyl transferase AbiEii/AbiGii toxin family protein [bacterium]|nr:nucleotidyl transferase AbiEii/AbiGii toxin family protein [bacterium]HPS28973.1 nucleotidyl transferase AbiEii/AbiGii toxin family protein [bacterium]